MEYFIKPDCRLFEADNDTDIDCSDIDEEFTDVWDEIEGVRDGCSTGTSKC
jgi:hypothetical protein